MCCFIEVVVAAILVAGVLSDFCFRSLCCCFYDCDILGLRRGFCTVRNGQFNGVCVGLIEISFCGATGGINRSIVIEIPAVGDPAARGRR